MLVSIDKRGSISLPMAMRKEMGLKPGSSLDLSVLEGGEIRLRPVALYPAISLSEQGLEKLQEARARGVAEMPDWLVQEMTDASADTK